MPDFKVTVCLPVHQRPERTKRILNCLSGQTLDKVQVIFGCDGIENAYMAKFDEFLRAKELISSKGGSLDFVYSPFNESGYGYSQRNISRKKAKGEFFVFIDNDDWIAPFHLENYFTAIACTNNDFMYFDTVVWPNKCVRVPELKSGSIGHSEIIFRTSSILKLPDQSPNYGHDWELINSALNLGMKHQYAAWAAPTYYIMSIPNKREKGID